MKSRALFGVLALGLVAAVCGSNDNMPTTPSPSTSATFTAALRASSEVPPVTGDEANGSGTATLTFNLTRDAAGTITTATMDGTGRNWRSRR